MNYTFDLTIIDDAYFYSFKINNGIEYSVSFESSIFIYGDILQLNIGNDYHKSHNLNFDPNVASTVIAIIQNFLDLQPHFAIVYICDSSDSDKRAEARARLFNKWFQYYNKGDYQHLQSTIGNLYYTGMLYSIYNPDRKYLPNYFLTLNHELGNKSDV